MYKFVLIRHGESIWNLENRFTGWADVDLTPTGIEQAQAAGRLLKAEGYEFDLAYTSVLKRAIHTLWHTLDAMDRQWLPVHNSWRLNERHYGALQGLNKAETAQKFGDAQVLDSKFLPPAEAFRVEATAEGADRLRVDFLVTPGYYLYRHRMSFAIDAGEGAVVAATEGRVVPSEADPIAEKSPLFPIDRDRIGSPLVSGG